MPVLLVRVEATRDGVRDDLANVLGPVRSHALLHGVTPAGPPFTRYASMEDGPIGLEAGLQLPRAVPGNGAIIEGELPAGEAATTLHVGSYSGLWAAYEALTYWMENCRRTPADEPWELYITDPREEPDSSLWQTEIVWPLSATARI